MSRPGNQGLVRKLRAAVGAHIRPTAMLLHTQPSDPWSDLDFNLVEAYQIIKDETSPASGQPIWLAQSTDPRIEWRVQTVVDYAQRAIEERRWRDSHTARERPSKSERKSWGTIYFARPHVLEAPGITDKSLPTREDFYKSLEDFSQ